MHHATSVQAQHDGIQMSYLFPALRANYVCSQIIYSGTHYARGNESSVRSTLFNLFIEKKYGKIN